MPYRAAPNHDNTAGFTTLATPPVCSRGIQYPAYIEAASGKVYPDGTGFCWWEFNDLTEAQYEAVLAALGLTTATTSVSGPVTIQTVTHDRSAFANYNATVVHKKGEDTEFADNRFLSARFLFKQLEAVA